MVKTNPLYTYETVVLDLSTARTGVEYSFSGNFIKVIEASDIDANIDVAFNSSGNDTVNLKKGRAIRANVLKWYLTNTAQAGKTVTLLIATEESLRIFDDGVVGDIDTIQEIIKPVAINYLPDKILSDQSLTIFNMDDETVSLSAATSYVLYTVPAGKIFYLWRVSHVLMLPHSIGMSRRHWVLNLSGNTHYLANASVYLTTGGGETFGESTFNPWIKMVAGDLIRVWNAEDCQNNIAIYMEGFIKNA